MSRPSDQDLDVSVAGMLRFGVSLAALVVFLGGVLLLRHPWTPTPDFSHFEVGDKNLTNLNLQGIFHEVMQLKGRSIIQLGLVILIATPVARVAFCVVGFVRQRNRLYVVVSLLVLLILAYSLSKGGRYTHPLALDDLPIRIPRTPQGGIRTA
jgi:uncharacterized membrane protein